MNEITIDLQSHVKKALYEQIYDFIKLEIREGRIPFGGKLPSTRSLGKHLQISRSTVELSYAQLLSEGYIESIPCKGYYVCNMEELYGIKTPTNYVPIVHSENIGESKVSYDFTPNQIDLSKFPYNAWRKASKSILEQEESDLLQLGPPHGSHSLRIAIQNYLYSARGVKCTEEQIIVGAGNEYLLMLLSQIIGNSKKIGMENPTYRQAFETFINMGHEVVPLGMDRSGIAVELLKEVSCEVVYVMPSHQFPLGIVMPMKRRLELLQWANAGENRYIIEDDHDSEFRYRGKPIPALQGYDEHEKVIYIGTFSKSIAPGMRTSYLVLPSTLMAVYLKEKSFYSTTVSRVHQETLQYFMKEGYFERHLNKMRSIYKNKHDLLINEIKSRYPHVQIHGENAGLHILVEVQNGKSEETIRMEALEQEVRVCGISEHYIAKVPNHLPIMMMLGYANLTEEEIIEGIKRLGEAFATQQ